MDDPTRSVHGGRDSQHGGLALPLFPASVYAFQSLAAELVAFDGGPDGYLYSRFDHPTGRAVEEHLASIQGSEDALLTASGMAAISLTLLTFALPGGHVLASSELYGGTVDFLRTYAPDLGLDLEWVAFDDLTHIGSRVRPDTRLIWFESPTNPLLKVVDFDAMLASLGPSRPLIAVDATLATPLGQDISGFDLAIHSATKYLGGHDDLMAGVVLGKQSLLDEIRKRRRAFGANLDPFSAWILERGLKTLSVRWDRQCANALELARRLESHPKVRRVLHPGLASHPQHAVAARQMKQFGALITVDLGDAQEHAARVHDALELILRAPSLGGVDTVVLHPATASHRALTREQRMAAGITDGMLRISVGIESVDDLWRDLDRALSTIG